MDASSANPVELPLETASQDHQHDDPRCHELQNAPLNQVGPEDCVGENPESRHGDACISGDPNCCSQDSVLTSKAGCSYRTRLRKKEELDLSKRKPLYASGLKASNGNKSSQRQHGYKSKVAAPVRASTVRALGSKIQSDQPGRAQRSKSVQLRKDPTFPVKRRIPARNPISPVKKNIPALKDSALSTRRAPQKTPVIRQVWQKKTNPEPSACQSKLSSRHTAPALDITRTGQRGKGQQSKPTVSRKDAANLVKRSRNGNIPAFKDPSPSIKRSGTQKTSATHQVWQVKTKAKPKRRQHKRSRKHNEPIHHITWNGFDELCKPEPLGLNCSGCGEDLSFSPRDDDTEYYDGIEPNLPDVAVLVCGHAFHLKCLEFLTSEEGGLSDPQCFLCANS